MVNTAEDQRRWKLLPSASVNLFSAPDRTPSDVSEGVSGRSRAWICVDVFPEEASLRAFREEARRSGENRVLTEPEGVRRARYRRRPRAQLGSLRRRGGGGGGGGAEPAGLLGGVLLLHALRNWNEMRRNKCSVGRMVDLEDRKKGVCIQIGT